MNIYTWYHAALRDLSTQGHLQLARQLKGLPSLVATGEHQQVDAVVPELLAATRAIQLPWLEVFVTHWWLQSRVSRRGEGASALFDVTNAFERAHRAEASDCPQSICTTEDLTICYANIDGPGYAAERINVADESVSRIDPSWACFQCMSQARIEALIDAGRPDAALDAFHHASRQVTAYGGTVSGYLALKLPHALLALERPDEALNVLESESMARHDRPHVELAVRRALLIALALARLGSHERARTVLPPFDEARPWVAEGHRLWIETVQALVTSGHVPDEELLAGQLDTLLQDQIAAHAPRRCAELALIVGRIAVARHARDAASSALDTAREQALGIRRPDELEPALCALAVEIDRLP